jgi:hypothetical protein
MNLEFLARIFAPHNGCSCNRGLKFGCTCTTAKVAVVALNQLEPIGARIPPVYPGNLATLQLYPSGTQAAKDSRRGSCRQDSS